jgi:excisionase family DNA binding protein
MSSVSDVAFGRGLALITVMDNNRSEGDVAEVDERAGDRRDALLLRIPDAAGLLGIGRTTLYKLIDEGELAVVRIGRAVRVPIVEVHAFVARNRRTEVVR